MPSARFPVAHAPIAHVVGSINRDIVAYASRLPKPGETVLGMRGALFPGGKGANQAVAIARLGHKCRMVGHVGDDAFGRDMTAYLAGAGVNTEGVARIAGVPTGFAMITVDDASENCITVVPGANGQWPDGLPKLALGLGDIVVAQLEVPLPIVEAAFNDAHRRHLQTILNPAPFQALPDRLLALTSVLILNETELAALTGIQSIDPEADADIARHVAPVLARGPTLVIVTLGSAGAMLFDAQGTRIRIAPRKVAAIDTTGAGDCFVGAFVARLLAGAGPHEAAIYASAAASISVTRDGAASSFPTAAEVEAALAAS